MKIKNSLVIPCYNEALNLKRQETILLEMPHLISGEVILVNNGSTDNTGDFIRGLSNINENIVAVNIRENIGYGFGILMGLKVARGINIGWTHADGQVSLLDVVAGFTMLSDRHDVNDYFLMGSRNGRGLIDQLFTVGMAIFESILFGIRLGDITAQPKIMNHRFVSDWENPPNDFSLDLYAYVKALQQGKSILKYDVKVHQRICGASTWNTGFVSRLKLIMRTIIYSIKLKISE